MGINKVERIQKKLGIYITGGLKMGKSIQKKFWENFMMIIVFPILLVFIVTIIVSNSHIRAEQFENLQVTINNYETRLENEIKVNALQFSHLLTANNKDVLQLISRYSVAEGEERYYLQNEIETVYNYMIVPNSEMLNIQFYLEDDSTYSFKNYMLKSKNEIMQTKGHMNACAMPNLIAPHIDAYSDYYGGLLTSDEYILTFTMKTVPYDVKPNVEIVVMGMKSDTLKELCHLDTSGYSAYIVDSNGDVLLKSDDRYEDELNHIEETAYSNGYQFLSRSIGNTGWDLILVTDKATSFSAYGKDFFFALGCIFAIFGFFYIFSSAFFRSIVNPIKMLSKEMSKSNLLESDLVVDNKAPEELQIIQSKYNQMIDKNRHLVESNLEKEMERHKEELKAMQLQINPHFISNTLDTIRFMAHVAKYDGIKNMTESLMMILNCSFRDQESRHTIESEQNMLNAYSYIMKIRYAESFEIKMDIAESCKDYYIPKLILQPFIENAITHGLRGKISDGVILVSISEEQEMLKIFISDNGRGISEDMLHKIRLGYESENNSIGIYNVRKRLKLYYGKSHRFEINSEMGGGTAITLYLPIEKGDY